MRRTMHWVPVAVAVFGLLVAAGVAAETAGGMVTDRATGVEFPVMRSVPGSPSPLALTGTGVRTKIVFKVYALGFYVDPVAARKSLAAWAGKSADDLRRDTAFYRELAGAPVDRLVVMHFVRDVGADKMREAMTEAMDRGVPANDPARAAFLALWKEPIRSGEDVMLLFGADGKVSLVRGGASVGAVESAALSRSVLQSWLGPDPVSEDIRTGIAARFPDVLRAP